MHLFLSFFILFTSLQIPIQTPGKISEPPKQQPGASQQKTNTDQRGTDQSPLIVKTLKPDKGQAELEQESADRQQKAANERWVIILTGCMAFIALGQLGVYLYQAIKLRETVQAAGKQSEAMDRHIGEATRSADAMETISKKIDEGNKAIIRAYLSVIIGMAIYQVRQDGVRFAGKPSLVNTGSTPARNVHVRISAALVPQANADKFDYPLPEEIAEASAVVAPHQSYTLNAMVKDFVPDAEVVEIKTGQGKALMVWGMVTYDDIFGQTHNTKFAQVLFWNPDNTVYGLYIPGQNDMD